MSLLIAELRQLQSFDMAGLRLYLRPPWNKLDAWNILSVHVVMGFRSYCWSVNDEHGHPFILHHPNCPSLQSWSRCIYAVTELTLTLRILNYLTVHEGLGILVIILGEMLANDVSLFIVLVLIISLGTGFSFTLLMPGLRQILDSRVQFASSGILMPFWGLLGMGDIDITQELGYESPTYVIVPLVTYFYLFLATVILINLLIAQMSATYDRVKENSRLFWLFERSKLILEAKDEKVTLLMTDDR